jgi:hypothetical protein
MDGMGRQLSLLDPDDDDDPERHFRELAGLLDLDGAMIASKITADIAAEFVSRRSDRAFMERTRRAIERHKDLLDILGDL